MKESRNKEIDLLLRSLAKQRSDSFLREEEINGDSAPDQHLDADELNSYAEGVLTPATRSRYVLHLADCARCRAIASKLSSGSVLDSREDPIGLKAGPGLWQKLGMFFSPQLFRYAVPVVVIFAIVAASIIALKQQRQKELVAQIQSDTKAIGEPNERRKAEPENSQTAAYADGQSESVTTTPGKSSNGKRDADQGSADQKSQAGKAATGAGSASTETQVSTKESPKSSTTADAVSQPSYAPETTTTSATKAQVTVADSEREKKKIARDQSDTINAASQKTEDDKTRSKDTPAENRVDRLAPAARAVSGRTAEEARGEEAKQRGAVTFAKRPAEKGPTRTVAGRHFHREGDLWLDSAYQASLTMVNVTRGSEQYRALLADEPVIRAVANELEGEIIVVWKGKAYRIH